MPINTEKRILYIHIPKTAGTYVEKMFNMYGNNFLHSSVDCQLLGRTLQHYPYELIRSIISTRNIMQTSSAINLKDYYVFTTIRNPYDRFFSAYHQFPNKCNQKFAEMINQRSIFQFAEFLVQRVRKEGFNFFKFGAYHQFQPMHCYLDSPKNQVPIDMIKIDDGDFPSRMKQLTKRFQLPFSSCKQNANPQNEYSHYFTNSSLLNCINEIYRKDFERFGYPILK